MRTFVYDRSPQSLPQYPTQGANGRHLWRHVHCLGSQASLRSCSHFSTSHKKPLELRAVLLLVRPHSNTAMAASTMSENRYVAAVLLMLSVAVSASQWLASCLSVIIQHSADAPLADETLCCTISPWQKGLACSKISPHSHV